MRSRLVALLVPLAWIIVSGAAKAKEPPLRAWLDGPVHYIVSEDEIRDFKNLKTDPERAAFVERFWRRRDPTPKTLANEYRQLFWQRVQEADEKFLDSAGPGWKTDRGKIYILYGPPEEVHEDPNARTGSESSSGTGLIRWIYRGRPGARSDLNPNIIVPFVRDVSGEYRVSYDPKLASPFFNPSQIEDTNTVGLSSYLSARAPQSMSPLGVMLDLGKMQEVPPQEDVLIAGVETVEAFAYEPLPMALDRFVTPTGELLAVLTVSIPGAPGTEPPTILAKFARPGVAAASRILAEGSFRVADDGASRIAQGRIALGAGTWELTVLAVDPASGANRVYRGRVDPIPGAGPVRLSDLVLARTMEPLPFAVQAAYTDPYIVGGFKVVPRVALSLPRGEPMRVFYEIYGGAPPYHVSYQLDGQDNDGSWRALGKPQEQDTDRTGQGFELPTGPSWPTAAYRLRVQVTDGRGAGAAGAVAFALIDK